MGPDVKRLADALTGRFGIEIRPTTVSIEGGVWSSVRPAVPEEPNGFAIVVSLTPRLAFATFQPDRFSGALLRTISAADSEQRQKCFDESMTAVTGGMGVVLELDSAPATPDEIRYKDWDRLGVECSQRLSSKGVTRDEAVLAVSTTCLSIVLALVPLEEVIVESEPGLPEGARIRAFVNRYERSPVNRARCLAHFGHACAACGFDFERVYGSLGAKYCEVHHRIPISSLGGSYVIDPIKDLIPLCANCHAMVHRVSPPLDVAVLKALFTNQ